MRLDLATGRRIALAALVIGVLLAAALAVVREDGAPDGAPSAVSTGEIPPKLIDPLRASLAHCAAAGEAALSDEACLAAWTEHRRRFLGLPPAMEETRDRARTADQEAGR
jgi:conjugative transfer region protein TrbK